MNLYKITQNSNRGYDTFDSAIVAAPDEGTARFIHPEMSWGDSFSTERNIKKWEDGWDAWAGSPQEVTAELIGTAVEGTETGVILASFNAG
jgi:hypothetical protein